MKRDDFYERTEVIHEVVEAKRSELCFNLINDLIAKENENDHQLKKKILDVGCGDGSFIKKFEKCCEVFGVDVSSRAVKIAEEAGITAYAVDVSREKLPFENEWFDIIYMGDVLEHLVNPDFAINEVARTLKPNGSLVLSTPNLASWLNRLLLLLGIQPLFSEVSTLKNFGKFGRADSFPVGHLRLFTCEALKKFLIYHQFKMVKVEGTTNDDLPGFLDDIDRIFSRIPSLSSIVIVIASRMQT